MHALRFSAHARRLGPLGTLLLVASCSSLLGIEDPVPRPGCQGDACEGGGGGVPSGGTPPVTAAGSENQPTEGGVGGGSSTAPAEGGSGGDFEPTAVGGESGSGGAPPETECSDEQTRCNAYQRQICNSGHWMDEGPECPLACVDGACQVPSSCAPNTVTSPCVGGVSCCETIWVPGGTYQMADGDEEDPEVSYSRTVSGFYLDRFEVTVGRLAAFATDFALPQEGDGQHPRIPGTGWSKAWEEIPHPTIDGETIMPNTKEALIDQLVGQCGASTWATDDQTLPANCVNWYVAFAFCAFDGGRLPTEAEWNFVAAAGASQRPYPWSETSSDINIDSEKATFYDYPTPPLPLPTAVGNKGLGRGGYFRYSGQGHDDLAGNVFEWSLDQWLDAPPDPCGADCLGGWAEDTGDRVIRGGAFESDYSYLRAGSRLPAPGTSIEPIYGFRCARDISTRIE